MLYLMIHYHIVTFLPIVLDPLVEERGTREALSKALRAGSVISRSYINMHTNTGRVYAHEGTSRITLK